MVTEINWYSVDSSSWVTVGAMGGILYPTTDRQLRPLSISTESPQRYEAGKHYTTLTEMERAAVDRVMRSGMLAQGPEVAAFEQEFAEHFGLGRACVAVNSGTSGLHLGLLASGIGPGQEVIVPSFTFAATANSVALTGATPVFATAGGRRPPPTSSRPHFASWPSLPSRPGCT